MLKIILMIAAVLTSLFVNSQEAERVKVTFKVKDAAGKPVDGATVALLASGDSMLVKAGITDSAGACTLERPGPDTYVARISHVVSGNAEVVVKAGDSFISASLETAAGTMQQVTIEAKKPFIQKLHDRLVVNVAGSIVSAGSSALEILERSPGVSLDASENILLRGRQGVVIMIDGKQVNLSSADLATYLRGIPSSSIERIDLITNPSARYDAAGSSGIIDIRLKKDQKAGANGTFTAGVGQGVYPKANLGATWNYRNKKVNVYGNYNYNYRQGLNHLFVHWDFFDNGTIRGGYDQNFYGRIPADAHNTRLGVDYFITPKTTIGVLASGNFNRVRRTNDNKTTALGPDNNPEYVSLTNTMANNRVDNGIFTLNLRHQFDTTGRELTVDADYGTYGTDAIIDFTSRYFNPDGNRRRTDYVQASDQHGILKIHTVKADYVHPAGKTLNIEAGIKASYVNADNDLEFFDRSNGTPVIDPGRTNRFIYDEYITAAYTNVKKDFKRLDVQLGLRAENTAIKGRQVVQDVRFDSTYLELFPSAFVNYKLNSNTTIGLSASRRIFRPDYSSLNPFVYFVDPSLYSTGTPSLKPEFTWLYEASLTRKGLVITAGYGHTRNIMTVVVTQSDTNKMVSVQQPVNLNSSDRYNVQAILPMEPATWWQINPTLEMFYAHFNGGIGNTMLSMGGLSYSADVNNSFILKNGWTAELTGRYRSRLRHAFMDIRGQWGINAGVQKQLWNNKGTVRLNVTDIFWTNLPRASTHYAASEEHWHAYRETRVANLSFTYRFGNNKVQAQRRRSAASEEERRRAEG